ncbi:thiol-disulfide oxidoreductase : Redoxin domain protein OS=Planctomyces brasiliensis (strain ATCC 49424 / DSM 5305 / JCM 21570 / NBRC 103401 / IFAM 1448) GN=Plabr_3782 PE=4 SV=1: Redoxin: Cu2_monoox_C [Gemmata massiliana]|uniref:Thioredoxin domain-containing protein n=1 Tax=Gemmata massiliana TaxID=1210884 RepID=A0A6P2CTT1_9BACT|nr:redoxin family protein [Gemmata massiliana]VTR92313.1 thiol-disulfide oxidoreductase : Redoxin domain protein OS=Planctomyces brasiliensis (strain ATCC 49424 / DSM 5305 / JCM 21570 / NBRC 103401 / IFAM 1448) GN=Plabr_3782 PE=4 SV=1: Redoxin: Cu2_monoox_C [Gemmata massiliana]
MRLTAFALLLLVTDAAPAADVAPAPREIAVADTSPKEAPKFRLPGEAGVGRLVPDVAFTDLAGKPGKLSDFRGSKFTVVAFTNTTCPLCKKYRPALLRLEKEFAARGVSFLFVNPTKTDKPGDHGFAGRYVHDTDGVLTAALGATATTEVFVLDSARTLQYRGAFNDQYGLGYALEKPRANYLVTALEDLLVGKQPVVQATTAPGCELTSDAAKLPRVALTYHARIERIVQANCGECHRSGGVAAFALDTYDSVVANKGMIRKVVNKGTMPPWFAAPPKKGAHSPFANDRTLAESDKNDLLAWLASDLKEGDVADAPLSRKYESGWLIGKPDVVYQISKPIEIPAEGVMPYQNASVETTYDEDKWVQALEVQPSAREVVHHVLVFALPKGSRGTGGEAQGFFAAYVPGNSGMVYPEGYAKKLPKGSLLRFQIHYTPNGKATKDQTKIGLIFAKQAPRYEVRVAGIANPMFTIPPGANNHKVNASLPVIPFETRILALFPHAHLRGKAAKYDLRTPDGKVTTLLEVPHYDFNWQLQYRFAEPVHVPRGSGLSYVAWYDNSDKNPANPDPTKAVKWGPQTHNEMHLGYVEFVLDARSTNENFDFPKPEVKIPKGGIVIPEQFKNGLKRFDTNGDGKLDEKEIDALPPAVKNAVLEYLRHTTSE